MPVMLGDSTVIYPAKKAEDISAKITLYRKVDKKTGNRIGEGTLFTIREKENVRALVELENAFKISNRPLMFHLEWLDENDNSIFLKRIELFPGDSSLNLNGSISISPDKRTPGEYRFRVYLFRELIAEKKFKLRPEYLYTTADFPKILKEITLCRSIEKSTGKRIGEDSVFFIKENGKVRAFADLGNLDFLGDRELKFFFDWLNADGKSFFRKQVDVSAGDSTSVISSFIPISPDVQQPGNYILQLHLFDDLIAEKKFELRNEPKITVTKAKGITAKIELCKSINKKTGERMGVDSVFTIGEKEKIRAYVDVERQNISGDWPLVFRVEWIGPNGKSFYRKEFDLPPGDSTATFDSSISVSPDNRKPGRYLVRVYANKDLIAEKKFKLR
jgi:hypothetical protein